MRLDVQEGLREQGNHKIILLLIVPTPLLCFKTRGLCRGCKFGGKCLRTAAVLWFKVEGLFCCFRGWASGVCRGWACSD